MNGLINLKPPTAKPERPGHDVNVSQSKDEIYNVVKHDEKAHYGGKHFWVLLVLQKYRATTAIESGQGWNSSDHEIMTERLSGTLQTCQATHSGMISIDLIQSMYSISRRNRSPKEISPV